MSALVKANVLQDNAAPRDGEVSTAMLFTSLKLHKTQLGSYLKGFDLLAHKDKPYNTEL